MHACLCASRGRWERDRCGGRAKWCISRGHVGPVFSSLQLLVDSWLWLLRGVFFSHPCTLPTPWSLPRTCPGVTRCAVVPDAPQGGRAAGAELPHGSGSSARSDGGVSRQGGLGHGRRTRGQRLPRVRCHLAEEGLGYKPRERAALAVCWTRSLPTKVRSMSLLIYLFKKKIDVVRDQGSNTDGEGEGPAAGCGGEGAADPAGTPGAPSPRGRAAPVPRQNTPAREMLKANPPGLLRSGTP